MSCDDRDGVTGSKDGLVLDNSMGKKSEPIVDVQTLKDIYLFGLDIKDNNGKAMPKKVYQRYIDNAITMLEHYLDISITPVNDFIEDKDYHLNDYSDWGYMSLNNFPVRRIRKIEMVYFRDVAGDPEVIQEIPLQWMRVRNHSGVVRLIPNARFPANLQLSQAGSFFPEILRTDTVPDLWRVTYDYGFDSGRVPVMINSAIGYLAAVQALITGGNLIIGAGIAGSSISIDGLSQSIQTTQSAENSGYSATIKDYQRVLFGANKDDDTALLKILKSYYKGQDWDIL